MTRRYPGMIVDLRRKPAAEPATMQVLYGMVPPPGWEPRDPLSDVAPEEDVFLAASESMAGK